MAVCLVAVLACNPALALNPSIRLGDLNHTSWSEKDGVPADINGMAQTRDGWLWLATTDGLYRFDGVRFERFPLPHSRVYNLHALGNGDLLISYRLGGMSSLHPDGTVTELLAPDTNNIEYVASMGMDHEGAIWAAGGAGLYRYANGKWEVMADGQEWNGRTYSVLVDQYGRVWASNDHALYLYDRSIGKLQRIEGKDLHGSLIQSPDGRVWVGGLDSVRPVPAPPMSQQLPRAPDANQAESRWAGQFDRDGNLWALKCPYGICRVTGAGNLSSASIVPSSQAREKLDQHWQLSALSINVLLEDREGNIWVSTQSGLDRFRENKLIPARIPGPNGIYSVANGSDGVLWVVETTNGAIWRIGADGIPAPLRYRTASLVANDRDGAILLAGKRDIERIYKGQSSKIALPPSAGKEMTDLDVLGLLDDGRVLWMFSVKTGLMGLLDGRWIPYTQFNLPKRIFMMAPGGRGQMWLSNNDGKLRFYDNDKLTEYDIGMIGVESGIFPGPQLIVAGEHGLAMLKGQKFVALAPQNSDALRNVTGMATTPDGDRWLNGSKGVVHIRRDDWEASIRQPATPLVYEVINVLEGYPGRAAIDNKRQTVHDLGNGLLWFRATGGLVRLDTTTLRPNTVKPAIQLLTVNVGSESYPARRLLELPPDSRSFNIQYTAPGLRKPEGMRFQYRFDGVDASWQDAGTRRAAYYTNVGPGRYTFNVRAVNEDGIASDAVASMQIDVAPTITQTRWFQVLCALAALLAIYGLYQLRLKAATRKIAHQLQVRTDERERIARTLHDTFLQSVQALTLRVFSVLTKMPEGSEQRVKLEAILDDADRTLVEGRDQVHQLRTGHDVEQSLSSMGESLALTHTGVSFEFHVEGTRRPLLPLVQEELTQIGHEALRNAFQHARASVIKLEIEYGATAYVVRISDNGRGLDEAEVQSRLKEKHWGMAGMRERAQRVGGVFAIHSSVNQGATVEIRTPAALAYGSRAKA
ncbi:sensor histidine kinase [Duganella aquatilis]|nr:sensor histidine kinase [Duganella aquatilis]